MRQFVLAAACLFATAASAQPWAPPSNGYISVSAGTSGEGEFSVDYANAMARSDVSLDSGASAQLAFGTRSGNWRLEAALSQRTHDAEDVLTLPPGGPVADIDRADVEVRAIDLNGYLDIPTGTMVRPYVGAGFGLAQVDLGELMEDTDSTLQLQAIGGVSADISPRVALFAEARFQRVGDVGVETRLTLINPPPQPPETFTGEDEFSFTTTQLSAGIRFSF